MILTEEALGEGGGEVTLDRGKISASIREKSMCGSVEFRFTS